MERGPVVGLLDNLERGLERAVRSAFSAGGPRAVKPVEIASALRQAMDDESFALSEGHTVAPNSYVVHFSPADFERARSWGSTLASELCDEVIRHADSQGYALPGTVRVAFHPDADVRAGDLRVVTRLDDGSLTAPAPHDDGASPATAHGPGATAAAPDRLVEDLPAAPPREPSPAPRVEPRPAPRRAAAPAAPAAPAHADQPTVVMGRPVTEPAGPALELDGRMLPLDGDDLILGRSAERADLVIPDSSVSREHLRLLTVGSTVTLLDLGSRNGVLVNGRRVDGSVTLRDGDVVTVGQTELLFFGGTGGRA
ncbi:pSer/pThr/pTyr-binding forkhead associated (FHA) protein [Micrococcaceae bacterium JKS001869]|nr:pSer/pThr/pTyr-binding forkhead associated (FHA) protein [Micrococcaceae bacterium JKS001869]